MYHLLKTARKFNASLSKVDLVGGLQNLNLAPVSILLFAIFFNVKNMEKVLSFGLILLGPPKR